MKKVTCSSRTYSNDLAVSCDLHVEDWVLQIEDLRRGLGFAE